MVYESIKIVLIPATFTRDPRHLPATRDPRKLDIPAGDEVKQKLIPRGVKRVTTIHFFGAMLTRNIQILFREFFSVNKIFVFTS